MTTQSEVVFYEKHGEVGVITINYPPVNALSQSVRQGLIDGIEYFEIDESIKAIIIQCAQRTFIAGADIKEFGQPPTEPFLPEVVNRIERAGKPVVAAMFGTSLGGGFEVALACHYRVALTDAKVGLPEVNLGLIPGAGGTQRLPRIVGVQEALEMVVSGRHAKASVLANNNLFDALFDIEENLLKCSLQFVQGLIDKNELKLERIGERQIVVRGFDWDAAIADIKRKARGREAPVIAAQIMRDTCQMNIDEGMAKEREAFLKLRESEQSAALRFVFGAEKQATKTNWRAEPLAVQRVAIIGGGNMGSGIATAFLTSGFSVKLIEQNQDALDAGIGRIKRNFENSLKRGRMSQSSVNVCLDLLEGGTNYQIMEDCDLIIEAVFEDLQIKKTLFTQLDKICKPDCVLATNTSYLDINAIASVLTRPQQLIGMHFFSPAHIMKLLEVVRAEHSSEESLVTAMAVAKRLKKVSVLVGVCFGFAGNRMYTRYGREIQQMLLEGAKISQVDQALTNWGMAMGPLAVQDLSGIDIGHNARSAQPFPQHDPGYFRPAATMVENGRLGRKSGKGFYDYQSGKASVDPEAERLIQEKARSLNIAQKTFSDCEIVERALLALASEGLALFREGIVQRLSDIDVIWLHGYGFPRHKGGPMYQARMMGSTVIAEKLDKQRKLAGSKIWPVVELTDLN